MRARENPFRSECLEQLAFRADDFSWNDLFLRWRQTRCRGAIIGPHGSGKTTLLLELAGCLRRQGFTVRTATLNEECRVLSPGQQRILFHKLNSSDVILLDGAEQLGWLRWAIFRARTHRAGGLIITTHRAGRLPPLYTCRTSVRLLEELVNHLVPEANPVATLPIPRLFDRAGGNIREALRTCYDLYAQEEFRLGWRTTGEEQDSAA